MTTRPYLIHLSNGSDMGYVTVWAYDAEDACQRALREASEDPSLLNTPIERDADEVHITGIVCDIESELEHRVPVPDAYVSDYTRLEREADALQRQLDDANERIFHLEAELSAIRAGDHAHTKGN